MTARVSVVMPAYNAEETIAEAMRSVAAQSYADWHLYVVDDASSDATARVVREMANQDRRITLIELPRNRGAAAARNAALDMVSSQYCAFLDSDDVWYASKLETQVRALEQGCRMCCTSYHRINRAGDKRIGIVRAPEECSLDLLLTDNVIGCSTVMLETSLLEERRFPDRFMHEDYALWLDLLQSGVRCAGIAEPLAAHRVRRGSKSGNKIRSACGRWRIYREYLGLPFAKAARLFARYAITGVSKRFPLRAER